LQEEINQIADEEAQFATLRKNACRNTLLGKNPQSYWYEYTRGDYLTIYNGN